MRAIVFDEPYSITIRVEGDLTEHSTRELSSRIAEWQDAGKKMRLDLGDVGSVDDEGAAWLRGAKDRGFGFTVMSPAVQRVAARLREASQSAENMGFFRRLLCALLPAGAAGCPCER